MTFLDLFAGVGGFRRGLELAGHKCVGFCEWDKFAAASYTSMHLITDDQRAHLATMELKKRQKEILKEEYRNGEWYSADVRLIRGDNVPRADCWCFGAPCQDFSAAGQRKGLDGDRSSLVREVFRVLGELEEEHRLEWLIYENVKGMLSSNRGWDFLAIILEMEQLGYDIEWELFNTKNFGVPQNRERVYTVGHLRRYGERKVFPLRGADEEDNICKVEQIAQQNSTHRKNPNQYRVYDSKGLSPCLNKMDGGGREPHTAIPLTAQDKHGVAIGTRYTEDGFHCYRNDKKKSSIQGTHVTYPEGKSHCISTAHIPMTMCPVKIREATVKGYAEAEIGDSVNLSMPESKTRRGRVGNGVANTLDCKCEQGVFVKLSDDLTVYAVWYEKYQCYIAIRKLTPRECFRLQGWTDDYFEKAAFVNSDSQLYKQAGNGVTVNVVQTIGEAIKEE